MNSVKERIRDAAILDALRTHLGETRLVKVLLHVIGVSVSTNKCIQISETGSSSILLYSNICFIYTLKHTHILYIYFFSSSS